MKVLFIHTLYAPHVVGGAELTLQTLVEKLAARGVEVVVLTTSDQPGLHQDEVNGVRVWRAGLRNLYWHFRNNRAPFFKRRIWHSLDIYNPLMAAYVRRVAEVERPDVTSCHNLPGWSVSAWSALTAQAVPVIQVLHDQYLLCPNNTMFKNGHSCQRQCTSCRLMRLPHPRLSRRLAGVVGVSHFILEHHRTMGYFKGVPTQRVIHNVRSKELLGLSAPSHDHESVPRPFRFGFIGTLAPNKGIELLLRIFAKQPVPDAELWIAGTGHATYEATLKRNVDSSAIRFLGRVKQGEFFPEVDVVIVPSLVNDTFPGAALEALAFGRPVIGSRRGGIPEMIEDGVNGLLFDPEQPEELAQAVRRLATDPQLRARMAKAARASAAPFLDTNHFLDQYQAVYQTAIEHAVKQRVNSSSNTEKKDAGE